MWLGHTDEEWIAMAALAGLAEEAGEDSDTSVRAANARIWLHKTGWMDVYPLSPRREA